MMLYDAISYHMFSWAPLLVMGPGTVYRLYPPLAGPGTKIHTTCSTADDRAAFSMSSGTTQVRTFNPFARQYFRMFAGDELVV